MHLGSSVVQVFRRTPMIIILHLLINILLLNAVICRQTQQQEKGKLDLRSAKLSKHLI